MMHNIIHDQFTANIYQEDSKQKVMGTSFVYKMHIYSKSLIFTLEIINLVDQIELNFHFIMNKHCEVLVSCSDWVDWIDF